MNATNNRFGFDPNSLSKQQLQKNWGWFLTLGISLVILGTFAVLFSFTATLFSVLYLGVFLTIMGLFEIIQSCTLNTWNSFFLHLFLGTLYIIGGVFIIANPMLNAITLTLVLALFFVVSGVLKIIFSVLRNVPHPGWLFFNGITTLILGILIGKEWPFSGLWVIGMLVGIDTIFTGWTLIMLSTIAKKAHK